jgi:hypothetical protein
MVHYDVVSKSQGPLARFTGRLEASHKLEQLVKAGHKFEDLKVEMVVDKKPATRARGAVGRGKNRSK